MSKYESELFSEILVELLQILFFPLLYYFPLPLSILMDYEWRYSEKGKTISWMLFVILQEKSYLPARYPGARACLLAVASVFSHWLCVMDEKIPFTLVLHVKMGLNLFWKSKIHQLFSIPVTYKISLKMVFASVMLK